MPEPSEQQFPDEDFLGGSTESTSGSPSMAGSAGNRPADGAPVMRPDEMTSDDWESAENAQDFLGLDGGSGRGPQSGTAAEYRHESSLETASALAEAPELEEGAFENWLDDDSEDSASWLMELDEQSGDDAFDPERLEAEFGIQQSATAASRGGWILRVTLVAAGLGAGFIGARWYGDHQAKSGAETTVAYVRPPANTQPANRNTNTQPADSANTANSAKQGPGANANTTANGDSPTKNGTTAQAGEGTPQAGKRPGQRTKNGAQNSGRNGANAAAGGLATAQPVIDSAPRTGNGGTDVTPDPFFPQPDSGAAQAPVEPSKPQANGDVASQGANGKGKSFTMPVEDMVVVPRVESPIKYADAKELASIWNEREIPLDKIGAAERMLTPQVGRVRLVIHGGEMFEGRLYAVGENKVWLDTGAGKMALLSWQVDRIEHITDTAAATPGAKGSEELAGLQHVRVRTPGGVFYGKLLDEDQGNVTLITEDGGRLRLANARVEPAGKSRTRIVDPEKAQAQEAASKNK